MTKDDSCLIEFDQNEFGTYFSGELVSGKVTITKKKPKQLTAIKLELCGLARCHWKRKLFANRPIINEADKDKRIFRGSEDYFQWAQYLIGRHNGPPITIPASTLCFKFSFQLPKNCPPSFQGIYGYVRYMVKVYFCRAGAFDRTIIRGLTILPLLDLNTEDPLLKLPTTNDTLEKMCFVGRRAVNLSISLPRSAYVPGELILVTAQIRNNAQFDCKNLIVKLNLCATYISNQWQSVTEIMTLVERICCPVPSNESRELKEIIRIPATPPTSEHLSKILRISYDVQVVANMGPFMLNPSTKIPITIGNVPYRNMTEFAAPSTPNDTVCDTTESEEDGAHGGEFESTETLTSMPITDDASISLDNSSPELNISTTAYPPSYEEAMFMRADISDGNTNVVAPSTPFVPHYPVFSDCSPMQLVPPSAPTKGRKKRRKRSKKRAVDHEPNTYDERLV